MLKFHCLLGFQDLQGSVAEIKLKGREPKEPAHNEPKVKMVSTGETETSGLFGLGS